MLPYLFSKKNDGYSGDVMALINVVNYLDFQCNHVAAAVIDLHEKGYVEDFVFSGEYLLWVQEKIYIRANDFSIAKCIQLDNPDNKNMMLLILGVVATAEEIKGILMYYYNYSSQVPAVFASLTRKLKSNSSKQLLHI